MRKSVLTTAFLAITATTFAQTDSSDFFLQKALEEKTKGRRMEVVKHLEKAFGYNNKNQQVVTELANAYNEVKFYAKAKEKFVQAEGLGDKSAATYKQLVNLSFNMRQWDDAIKYAQLLKKADASEKVNYYIGRAYYEQEDLGKGIQFLELAAKEDPTNGDIPHTLATAYTNMQNFRLAIPHFQNAIKLQPANSRWIYEMALVYYGMNDNTNALKYMLEAGEKGYRKDMEYTQNLATAYMNAGKFAEGLEVMKQVLDKRPTDIGLIDMIAETCYNAGKFDDAINYYNKILTIDEKKADALYMMGMAYQKKGQEQNGRALCDKAIAMDPSLASLKTEKKMPGGF
ncbi:MAG: tetratricopeptide repeat protein [Chitinophagaceae bacterium]|nr:MAG: tetratricopeptide repeat protein [Chitinophagaceae bacterium]